MVNDGMRWCLQSVVERDLAQVNRSQIIWQPKGWLLTPQASWLHPWLGRSRCEACLCGRWSASCLIHPCCLRSRWDRETSLWSVRVSCTGRACLRNSASYLLGLCLPTRCLLSRRRVVGLIGPNLRCHRLGNSRCVFRVGVLYSAGSRCQCWSAVLLTGIPDV